MHSPSSDDVPMTCGGCDLSVAYENCILTLASVAWINKISECFTQLQACYRKFCLFRNMTAFTKPELVKYDLHTLDTMQVSAVSDHCHLNMEQKTAVCWPSLLPLPMYTYSFSPAPAFSCVLLIF